MSDAGEPSTGQVAADLSPADRVWGYFDKANLDLAVRALRSYYGVHDHYTGAAFDRFHDRQSPNRFTGTDFLAVSMLSVNVPARACLNLLASEDSCELLRRIPAEATIWADHDLLERNGAAWQLWDLVHSQHDVGDVTASKLLAAKRPHLLPIHDQHVAVALGYGKNEHWAFWRSVVTDRQKRLQDVIVEVRSRGEIPRDVSDLRVIDVVVWMRAHGWTTHASACGLGCDFTGFD